MPDNSSYITGWAIKSTKLSTGRIK